MCVCVCVCARACVRVWTAEALYKPYLFLHFSGGLEGCMTMIGGGIGLYEAGSPPFQASTAFIHSGGRTWSLKRGSLL